MAQTLKNKLDELCYVRRGSGSTKNSLFIIVKNQASVEVVEAAELLVRALYPNAARSSFGTFVVDTKHAA